MLDCRGKERKGKKRTMHSSIFLPVAEKWDGIGLRDVKGIKTKKMELCREKKKEKRSW